MEGSRNRQQHGTLGTTGFARFAGTFDGRLAARDDGLPRRIEVDRFDNHAIADFGHGHRTGFTNLLIVQIENRRHRAFADRHGFLHGRGAQANQRHGILEGQHPGSDQRRIFAQTMPGDDAGLFAPLFLPQSIGSNRRRQHQRLGIDGLRQEFGGAFGNQLPQILPQRFRGFVEGRTQDRRITVSGHHADRL